MPPARLRVDWSEAVPDLEDATNWAPAAVVRVFDTVEQMADLGWSLGHPTDRPGVRYWSVPPLGVLYEVRGDELRILQIVDPRRLRGPLW